MAARYISLWMTINFINSMIQNGSLKKEKEGENDLIEHRNNLRTMWSEKNAVEVTQLEMKERLRQERTNSEPSSPTAPSSLPEPPRNIKINDTP